MNCPICKTSLLTVHRLNPSLESWRCDKCGGQWITSAQFSKWRETHQPPAVSDAPSAHALSLKTNEAKVPRICPECQHILVSYKVGHDTDFSLDRCGTCGGTWFDKNEWKILEGRNLSEEIHLIFSATWQHRVREEEHFKHLQQLLVQQIGERDFAEIQRVKKWLKQHPHQAELRAYLNHDDF